ncbi:MAG: hypothetical protein R2757_22250 [Draconibacterium sp.]
MKKNILFIIHFCLFTFAGVLANAQEYTVEVFITNQPDNRIVFGSVKGDDFTPIDSTFIYPDSRKVVFRFNSESHIGVYRVVLGKTTYAKVMDEPPQQVDFIFNKENIVLKTDYKEPMQKLVVVKSAENDIWFEFLAKDKILKDEIKSLETQIDYYLSNNDSDNLDKVANEYNTLQIARDLFIQELAKTNSSLLVSAIIYNQRLPVLDGYLTKDERNEVYRKDFFKVLDFSDERLIQSSVYTDKVFEYLVSYNIPEFSQKQREDAYIKAVDIVLPAVNKNKNVYSFIRNYLLNGFKMLQLQHVIDYVNKNYPA